MLAKEANSIAFLNYLAISVVISGTAFLGESFYRQNQAHAMVMERQKLPELSSLEIQRSNEVIGKERAKREAVKLEKTKAEAIARLESEQNQMVKTCSKNRECYTLAEAVYFETRDQPQLGQVLVAQVIINRTKKKQFPSTIKKVVYQQHSGVCQFSYVCLVKDKTMHNPVAKKQALIVARKAMLNQYTDKTKGADHYYNPALASPVWAPKMEMVLSFADHKFLKAY